MAIARRDDTFSLATGEALSGALVYYLEQPANVSALAPLAPVYADAVGTPSTNPQITDGFGHATAYLSTAYVYTIVYYLPYLGYTTYADQTVGSSAAVGGTNYSEVPAGVIDGNNVVFSLTHPPIPNSLVLQRNGVVLIPGLGYTLSGTTITYALAPQPTQGSVQGDLNYANYQF